MREIQIPLMPIEEQKEIGNLIIQSQDAQRFGKSLLRRADAELTALFGNGNEETENETA
jgi:restriction endonuclease S subunit